MLKQILQRCSLRSISAVLTALTLATLLVVPDGDVEGAVAPGSQNLATASANQSTPDIEVYGPDTLSVLENTAIGESVATYRVVTAGGADVSGTTFSFSLAGADVDKYAIDSRSGELFTAAWLDYETDTTDSITVVAAGGSRAAILHVTVNVENVEDSVSTIRISKANPVPGVGQGNPEHALDANPIGYVETEWANWGTILRIVANRESPDPDCGTGLECIFVLLESDEAGDEKTVKALRSGERGAEYVAAVKLVASESETGETIEITGADSEVQQAYILTVEDEDEVVMSFDNLRDSLDVENEPPEFGEVTYEQELAFGSVDVDFRFEVTDADPGLPEPEDLPDVDGDQNYTPVVGFVHDSQCFSSDSGGQSLEAVEGINLTGGYIYCDGEPEIHVIRDDRDFEEIADGYSVRTTLVLEKDSTYFVSFVGCDYAGNCALYDADDQSDALLLRIDTLTDEPVDPCVTPISMDGTIEGEWDGTCPSGREPERYGGDGDRYARYYTFSLDSAADVTIALTSDEDTYLYLLEGAGKDGIELHENDDIVLSQNLNSRIEANIEAGEYTIEATTYYSQATGEFTIEVRGIGEAPSVDADCSSGIAVSEPDNNAGLVSDCEVLLAARDRLAGSATLNWSADVPVREWKGVAVSYDLMRVVSLGLYDQGMTGVIPPELGDLDRLEELSLGDNELSGEIPPELGGLANLRSLYLSENRLTGPIPPELGSLNLKGLSLSRNLLTGSIPPELSHITDLGYLELDDNQLTGPIPQELGRLVSLVSLRLAGNQLTGCIPFTLRNVHENDYDELGLPFCPDAEPPPPDACFTDMGDFATRSEVIDEHWDTDCVSVNRPGAGDTFARFFTFGLDEEADVTVMLESDEDAYLYLMRGEGRSGRILHENDDHDGTNPRIRTTLQPGIYTAEATTFEIGATGDFRISVETEELNGRSPITCVDLETLTDMESGHRSGIEYFIDSDCASVNRPNNGEYYARYAELRLQFPAHVIITLTSEKDPYLFLLEGEGVTGAVLYENDDADGTNSRIEVTLQPGTYTLEATTYEKGVAGFFVLEVVVESTADALCENGLAVSAPDDNPSLVYECARLLDAKYIFAADPPLNWSADVSMEEWEGVTLGGSPLQVTELDLRQRGLTGRIPDAINGFFALQKLMLSGNRLTGELPFLINQVNLEYLDVSSNRMSGGVSLWWHESPSNLQALYLGDNKFSGQIPPELSRLTNLEEIELSDNRLHGEIPPELADLPNLYGLWLSGNDLSGCIPYGLIDAYVNDFDELGLPFCPPPPVEDCVEPLPAVSAITIRDAWEDGCRSESGDRLARYYTLSLDEPTLVGLGLSTGHGGYLLLREGEGIDGRIVEQEEDFEDIVYSVSMLAPGKYTIEVADDPWNGGGEFSLMVRLMENVGPREETDVSALMALYLATGGGDWDVSDNWLTGKPLSDWHGVVADSAGRVVELRVAQNNLRYRLPPELGSLRELRVLHLENNELLREIPRELGKLRHLRELRLSFNDLTGAIPAGLGNLSNLVELHLNDNDISGEVPPELGKLRNIELFDLGHNELTGQIPPELGNMTNVRVFSLQTNHLTGSIPAELGSLNQLTQLSLSHNGLRGEIPSELVNLSQLEELTLGNNLLGGSIPPELGDLQNLKILDISHNGLSGALPSDLSNLGQLEYLRLEVNFLSGGIPPELGNLRSLKELDLTNNRLTGEIPRELGKLVNLETLALGGCNGLSGEIPVELSDLTSLSVLYLYTNSLTGEIPKELAELQELKDLRLFRNNLTGEIPSELGELSGLEHLIISFNRLEGEIPSELGDIHELRQLDLEENLLTGEIPKSLADLQHLFYSDFRRNELTGCIPYGMKGVVETDPVLPVCPAP